MNRDERRAFLGSLSARQRSTLIPDVLRAITLEQAREAREIAGPSPDAMDWRRAVRLAILAPSRRA